MKKILFATILAFFGLNTTTAQLKSDADDHFFYDLSHVRYLNAPDGFNQKWYSFSHTFTLMGDWSWTDHLGMGYGLGFSSQNFHNNMRMSVNASGEESSSIIDEDGFNANRQNVKYIYVPLELRLYSSASESGKQWRLHLGARGGLRVWNYSNFNSDNQHLRYYNLSNFSRYTVDGYLRVGYGRIGLIAVYGLNPIFEEGRVISGQGGLPSREELNVLRPLQLGLTLSL